MPQYLMHIKPLVLLACKIQITSDDHIIIKTFIKSKQKTGTSSPEKQRKTVSLQLNAAASKLILPHI